MIRRPAVLRRLRGAARVAILTAALLPPAAAAVGSVGLSSVGGKTIANFVLAENPVESSDRFGFSFAAGDFNGDGASDLATGVPYDDLGLGQTTPRGSVFVQLGTAGGGLSAASPSLLLTDPSGAHFGWALAAGDFNGDAIDDLAVGSPEGIVGFGNRYGFVRIFYGSATPEVFGEAVNVSNVGVLQEARTGFALAAGNWNGDAFDDLAIASPALNTNAGAIRIAYGGASGLADPGSVIDQDTPGAEDVREAHDLFGYSLAAGDFDGNGDDDLAVGVVNENQVGFVQVPLSTASGIDPGPRPPAIAERGGGNRRAQRSVRVRPRGGRLRRRRQGRPGDRLAGRGARQFKRDRQHGNGRGRLRVDLGDLRSRAHPGLGAGRDPECRHCRDRRPLQRRARRGDFDADGYADLAIGQPEEDVTGTNDGALTVHMGGPNGFSQLRARFLAAGTDGLPGPIQAHSNFGSRLRAATSTPTVPPIS